MKGLSRLAFVTPLRGCSVSPQDERNFESAYAEELLSLSKRRLEARSK
jgi:hypothetical protein